MKTADDTTNLKSIPASCHRSALICETSLPYIARKGSHALAALFLLGLATIPTHADTFGLGSNSFDISFVAIGNPGNGDDMGAGGGVYSSLRGGVGYAYRMGIYEVSQADIQKASALGLMHVSSGPWTGDQPATQISWAQAAAFVNWLNVSTGHTPAYNLTYSGSWTPSLWDSSQAWQLGGENLFRNKDAYYFLPSDDEWIKAAYHQNDGVTANYWDFPTASNTPPDGLDFAGDPEFDAVFDQGYNPGAPYDITNAGGRASAYGTYGQGGNVFEWVETQTGGTNNTALSNRAFFGGSWAIDGLSSASAPGDYSYVDGASFVGFRVASVPEPSSAALLGIPGVLLAAFRRTRRER